VEGSQNLYALHLRLIENATLWLQEVPSLNLKYVEQLRKFLVEAGAPETLMGTQMLGATIHGILGDLCWEKLESTVNEVRSYLWALDNPCTVEFLCLWDLYAAHIRQLRSCPSQQHRLVIELHAYCGPRGPLALFERRQALKETVLAEHQRWNDSQRQFLHMVGEHVAKLRPTFPADRSSVARQSSPIKPLQGCTVTQYLLAGTSSSLASSFPNTLVQGKEKALLINCSICFGEIKAQDTLMCRQHSCSSRVHLYCAFPKTKKQGRRNGSWICSKCNVDQTQGEKPATKSPLGEDLKRSNELDNSKLSRKRAKFAQKLKISVPFMKIPGETSPTSQLEESPRCETPRSRTKQTVGRKSSFSSTLSPLSSCGTVCSSPPPQLMSGLSPTKTQVTGTSIRQSPHQTTFADLVNMGLLKPGDEITVPYLHKYTFSGTVNLAGLVQLDGKEFSSPPAFALYCKRKIYPQKKSDRGWTSCYANGIQLGKLRSALNNDMGGSKPVSTRKDRSKELVCL